MPYSTALKNKAILLRKSGYSYNEIHKLLNIPKSTLSDWLRSYKLTTKQMERFRNQSLRSLPLASLAHTKIRLKKTNEILSEAKKQINNLTNNDLWHMGTVLYWAEGSKQKEHSPSKGVVFSNSDPSIIKIFLKWLKECLKVSENQIVFEIYIHESYKRTIPELTLYWSSTTKFPVKNFQKVYFKKNKIHSYRKNRGPEYHGVLRISVKKSTDLNRKITGWTQGIYQQFFIS